MAMTAIDRFFSLGNLTILQCKKTTKNLWNVGGVKEVMTTQV